MEGVALAHKPVRVPLLRGRGTTNPSALDSVALKLKPKPKITHTTNLYCIMLVSSNFTAYKLEALSHASVTNNLFF